MGATNVAALVAIPVAEVVADTDIAVTPLVVAAMAAREASVLFGRELVPGVSRVRSLQQTLEIYK